MGTFFRRSDEISRTSHSPGRRRFLGALGAASMAGMAFREVSGWQAGAPAEPGRRLLSIPTRVFKVTTPKEPFETWVFNLTLEAAAAEPVSPIALTLTLLSGKTPVKTVDFERGPLDAVHVLKTPMASRTTKGAATFWVLSLRVRMVELAALKIDGCHARLDYTAGGAREVRECHVAVESYVQKTKLAFPFQGKGMITQSAAAFWGHRNRSGQFAVDALGLTEHYAPMVAEWGTNAALAGWGRPLLAPADGVIVVARGDRPDQPVPGNSDPRYYAPDFKDAGDPGNYVVIDHGGSEFSMIAHLQAKSLRVAVGERVKRGQPIGALGNSGDSTAPHVHHQLQAGPDWEYCDALPRVFDGLPEQLAPGTYFESPR